MKGSSRQSYNACNERFIDDGHDCARTLSPFAISPFCGETTQLVRVRGSKESLFRNPGPRCRAVESYVIQQKYLSLDLPYLRPGLFFASALYFPVVPDA